MPFVQQVQDAILHGLHRAGDQDTAGVTERGQMRSVLEEMLNLDGHIIGEGGKFLVQSLYQGHGMPDAVEKIRIAKGYMLGPSRDLTSNVLQDHLALHNPKATRIDRHNRAMATQMFTATTRLGVAGQALLFWPHDEAGIGERRWQILPIWHQKL